MSAVKRSIVRNPKSSIDPAFGEWLVRARNARELTQAELAKHAGMTTETVRRFERGQRLDTAVAVETFARLARGLDMELGYVLHRAGFDIGTSGINLARLRRVENSVESFAAAESMVRQAISEAMELVDKPGAPPEVDRVIANLGRALGAHDLVCERLRQEGFLTGYHRPESLPSDYRRPWTAAEESFLRGHPDLAHAEVGRQLFRTADAVRAKRKLINKEES